jgi:hypothetical protein
MKASRVTAVDRTTADLTVAPIDSPTAMDMVTKHHYSRRKVGVKHAYGLFDGDSLVGCVVYSIPASYTLCRGVCGPDMSKSVLELSRLVVTTKAKNAASQLVGGSLRQLGDAIVVSYADANERIGHVGYIYQATNWLYTGRSTAEPVWLHPETGQVVSYTRRHIDRKAEALGLHWSDLVKRPQQGKHRYVIFTGNKTFRRAARKALRWDVGEYPKGISRRHTNARQNVVTT